MTRPDAIREGVVLAPWTTMRLGGPARYFAECVSVAEIRASLKWAAAEGLSVQILGGGSNALFPDAGYDGLVLKIALRGIEFAAETVQVAAGEDWDPFVQTCVERGLAGVECLSGIPGLVGATPIQNVGAYGQEVKETIVEVKALDRENLTEAPFSATDCRFAYRQSRFKTEDRDRFIITAVSYRLDPSGQPQIRYPELRRQIGDELDALEAGRPALAAVRRTVLALRRGKSMVIDPADPNSRSVGSFYVNPVVAEETYAQLQDLYPDIPRFPAPDGVKVPAAWLVEQAGFRKGLSRDGVGISDNHALALVNRGGTTSAVLALATEIQQAVERKFGIRLQREPVLIAEGA